MQVEKKKDYVAKACFALVELQAALEIRLKRSYLGEKIHGSSGSESAIFRRG